MLDSFYVARKIDGGKVSYRTLHPYRGQEWISMVQSVMKQQEKGIAYPTEKNATITFASEPDNYYIAVFREGRTIEYRGFWTTEEINMFDKGEI